MAYKFVDFPSKLQALTRQKAVEAKKPGGLDQAGFEEDAKRELESLVRGGVAATDVYHAEIERQHAQAK